MGGTRKRPSVPEDEPKRQFLYQLAEVLLERLPAKAKKKTPRLLSTAWEELTGPEQGMAVCFAFLAGVSAPPSFTYDRLLSPRANRRGARIPGSDPRVRAFRLGRHRSSRPLLRLLFKPWSCLDRGGQVLAVELAECLGRRLIADLEEHAPRTDAIVSIVEVIARLPLGEGQHPLADPRIVALERGAKRPMALEAALHRLGLTRLSVDDIDRPHFKSESLLDIAVCKLTELARGSDEWRSFPGIWIPLRFSGRPTEKLCFLVPEGKLRRVAENFAGAWVTLACDCFIYAAACRESQVANVAATAGCALLALVPRDDPLMSRTTLHVSADVARLSRPGSKVDKRLRRLARLISSGELRAEVEAQEQTIIVALNRSNQPLAKRAGPGRASAAKGRRPPERFLHWAQISDLLETQRVTNESMRAELAKANDERERVICVLTRIEQLLPIERSAGATPSVVHASTTTETRHSQQTRSCQDKRALRRLKRDQPLLDLDGLTFSPIKVPRTLYVLAYEDGSDSAVIIGQGSDGVRRARYARAKLRRCFELVSEHQASRKTLTVAAVQAGCDVHEGGAAERLLRDTLRLAREIIPGPRTRLTRVNALSLFPRVELARNS